MKKYVKKIFCFVLCVLLIISVLPLHVFAVNTLTSGSCGENVTYSFNSSTGTLTISGFGAMTDYQRGDDSPFANNESIISVIVAEGVTSIGECGFYQCSGLKNLTLPRTLTSIGNWCFYGDKNIENLYISNIGNWCATNIGSSYSSPFSWSKKGNIFLNNSLVTNLVIPSGITSINSFTFSGCNCIKTVSFPDSLTTINNNAFEHCNDINQIIFGNGLKTISSYAFSYCNGLTDLSLPDGLELVQSYAFGWCASLERINIPASVSTIGTCAFCETGNLSEISVSETNTKYDSRNNCNAIIETATNKLLTGCCNTIIPNSTTSIGRDAFRNMSSLRSINIPASVKDIGAYAFSSCKSLESVTFSAGLETIGSDAFYYCSSLKNIVLPETLTKIEDSAFGRCTGLESVNISSNVKRIEKEAFSDCEKLKSVVIPKSVDYIGGEAFAECDSLEFVTIKSFNCQIDDGSSAWYLTDTTFPTTTEIRACSGSTAETYANENNMTFVSIGHDYEVIETTATCLTDGTKTMTCKVCGESYTNTISATGHDYVSTVIEQTCTENGYTINTCSKCGDFYTSNIIDAKGHDYRTRFFEPTCTEEGYNLYTCIRCGSSFKSDFVSAVSHVWGDYISDNNATYVLNGTKTRICKVCGTKETVVDENSILQKPEVYADDLNTIPAGEQITIPVRIEKNNGLMGCKINVSYNKDNLIPASVTLGEVFTGGLEDNITGDAKPGKFCIYWAGSENVTADGILFNLVFNVKKSAKGDDTIGLSYSQEDTFDENFNDVVLDCHDISLTYTNTIAEDVTTVEIDLHENAPINVGDIFAADIIVKNVNSDLTDNLSIEYDHEKFELVEFAPANNNTTLEDDVLKINSLPGGTTAVGTLVFKAISKESAGENQIVLIDGENAIGSRLDFEVTAPASSNEITVSGSMAELDKDGNFKVNVNFAGNSGIMGYKMRFTYDPSLIRPVSVSKSEKFNSGDLTTNIGKTNGEFVVAWHNTQDVFGDGDAFAIQFKRITEEPTNTTIATTYSSADTFNENWEDVILNTQDISLTINDSTELFNVYGGDEDSHVSAKAGESVTIPVNIKDNPGLMGTRLTFDYNADFLTPVSVTSGDVFSGGLQDNIDGDAVPGSFNVYWAGSQNVYDNGILFFITFSVSENATGQEEIAISYSQEDTFDENFDDVTLKCQNILVKYQSIPQYTPMFNLSLADNVPVYAGDNFAVNIAIANAPESINESFNLNFDSTRFEITDFVAKNGINATLANNKLSINSTGLSGNVAIGSLVVKAKGVYGSESNEIAIVGSEIVLGNKVVLDVLESSSASGITLSSEVFDLATDGSFKVRINCNDNVGIMGYKLRFTYNPSIIQPISATKGSLFSAGTLTNNIGNKTGEFVSVWQSTQDVVGDGEMLVLSFKALSTENISTALGVSYSAGDTFNEEWQPVVINCEEIPIVLDFSLAKISLTCDFSEFDLPINGGNLKVLDETQSVAANEAFDKDNFTVQLDKGKTYSVIITVPKRVSIKINNISANTSVDLNEVFDKSKQNGGFDVQKWPIGDVNASDVIDIGDISSLLKVTNYGFRVQNAENKYCDLNDDSVIDIADISLILATANYGKSGVVIDYAVL